MFHRHSSMRTNAKVLKTSEPAKRNKPDLPRLRIIYREITSLFRLNIVILHTKTTLKDYIQVKILTTSQIKAWDQYTIEHEPIASIDLMERAAQAITEAIARRWGKQTPIKVFAGPGNNGGDALATARMLSERGYAVEVYLFNTAGKLSEDCATNRELLLLCEHVKLVEITNSFAPPQLTADDVVIDGLFGSGLNKPLNGGYALVVQRINRSSAKVVSIDIPSGLMCEDNSYNQRDNIIRADLTLTIGQIKLSFLFPENESLLGEVEVLDIRLHPDFLKETETPFHVLEKEDIARLLRPRRPSSHKGDYGHALLIAGRVGMAGASVLAAQACLRSGVGLLTVHAPTRNNDILQISVPEAMVDLDDSDDCFMTPVDDDSYHAVAVGPGLGKRIETAEALIAQLQTTSGPMVLDADALNILAQNRSWMNYIPKNSILTPHPKELERMVGACNDTYERITRAHELAAKHQVYVVLKGAWTAIITPEGRVTFNPTGNPGMATGGSGDVLTGILLALLAQGYDSESACRLGVYVHGLAGDLAAEAESQTAMTAGSIIRHLPEAWKMVGPAPTHHINI